MSAPASDGGPHRPDIADRPDVVDDLGSRVTVTVHLDPADWSRHLAAETRRGLLDDPPWIPPVWFYDEVGSKLFDEITRLPEYYPTDAERSVLARHAPEIARLSSARTLVELGSGTSEKTTLLLDALRDHGSLDRIVPFDVSEEVLRSSARSLAAAYPSARVDAVVGDFHRHLDRVRTGDTTMVAFLGSTIGNLDTARRTTFLAGVHDALASGDWFLLGSDLVKPVERLLAAYDDTAGVTAMFDLNALDVLDRELGADFDRDRFTHRAHWDPVAERIEMHLVADGDQRVVVSGLGGLVVELADGAHIRTEISAKFHPQRVDAELTAAGLHTVARWTDDDGDFLVTLARRD